MTDPKIHFDFDNGANTSKVESLEALKAAYLEALAFEGTSVIVVPITKELTPLFG